MHSIKRTQEDRDDIELLLNVSDPKRAKQANTSESTDLEDVLKSLMEQNDNSSNSSISQMPVPDDLNLSSTHSDKHVVEENIVNQCPGPMYVFASEPSRAGQTMRQIAREQGLSLTVLLAYNQGIEADSPLPNGQCLLVWQHSIFMASCFCVQSIDHSGLIVGELPVHNIEMSRILRIHISKIYELVKELK